MALQIKQQQQLLGAQEPTKENKTLYWNPTAINPKLCHWSVQGPKEGKQIATDPRFFFEFEETLYHLSSVSVSGC
jgi:hypothetical protein